MMLLEGFGNAPLSSYRHIGGGEEGSDYHALRVAAEIHIAPRGALRGPYQADAPVPALLDSSKAGDMAGVAWKHVLSFVNYQDAASERANRGEEAAIQVWISNPSSRAGAGGGPESRRRRSYFEAGKVTKWIIDQQAGVPGGLAPGPLPEEARLSGSRRAHDPDAQRVLDTR